MTAVDAVRALLEPAGAPEPVAVAAVDALGADAAEQLGRDPWRVLAVPGVPPAAADALARSVEPRWRADDVRRGAALVGWLLGRAAADGHTVARHSVVASALTGYDVGGSRTGTQTVTILHARANRSWPERSSRRAMTSHASSVIGAHSRQSRVNHAILGQPDLREAQLILKAQFPEGVPTVMDPFCGGGSTLVEAQRLAHLV